MDVHLVFTRHFPLYIGIYHKSAIRNAEAILFFGTWLLSNQSFPLCLSHFFNARSDVPQKVHFEKHISSHTSHNRLNLTLSKESMCLLNWIISVQSLSGVTDKCLDFHMDVYGGDNNFICVPLLRYVIYMVNILFHFLPGLSCFICWDPHKLGARIHPISRIIFENFLSQHRTKAPKINRFLYFPTSLYLTLASSNTYTIWNDNVYWLCV